MIDIGKVQVMVTEELEAQLRAGGRIVYLAEELDDRMVREYSDGRREYIELKGDQVVVTGPAFRRLKT